MTKKKLTTLEIIDLTPKDFVEYAEIKDKKVVDFLQRIQKEGHIVTIEPLLGMKNAELSYRARCSGVSNKLINVFISLGLKESHERANVTAAKLKKLRIGSGNLSLKQIEQMRVMDYVAYEAVPTNSVLYKCLVKVASDVEGMTVKRLTRLSFNELRMKLQNNSHASKIRKWLSDKELIALHNTVGKKRNVVGISQANKSKSRVYKDQPTKSDSIKEVKDIANEQRLLKIFKQIDKAQKDTKKQEETLEEMRGMQYSQQRDLDDLERDIRTCKNLMLFTLTIAIVTALYLIVSNLTGLV